MPPATGYASISVTLTNSASIIDPLLAVDLGAVMPAEWWAAVDTSDGTKGRAYTSGGTELACDWIDFNDGAETGYLRVKWSGTVTAGGAVTLHIYPPVAANAAVAASDTYGSDNAYPADNELYLPFNETSGTTAHDRTGNGNDAESLSSQAVAWSGFKFAGGVDPSNGGAFSFAGFLVPYAAAMDPGTSGSYTVMMWADPNANADGYFGVGSNVNAYQLFNNQIRFDGAGNVASPAQYAGAHHVAFVQDGSGRKIYVNGSLVASDSETGTDPNPTDASVCVGGTNATGSRGWNGLIAECAYYSADLSADEIALEYQQTDDNAAFWGTGTWVPLPSGGRRVMVIG